MTKINMKERVDKASPNHTWVCLVCGRWNQYKDDVGLRWCCRTASQFQAYRLMPYNRDVCIRFDGKEEI
ncbi:hypothetical protein LCGC14_2795390 [marine sediment metagenome]|uniref:Uncharacterized protein n=1 Tax=marine sediment metagenome TaxID=412755 RepID=A0A0F9BFN7_9ZZZZ